MKPLVVIALLAGVVAAEPATKSKAKPPCAFDHTEVSLFVIRHTDKDLIQRTTDDNIPRTVSQFVVQDDGAWEYWEAGKKGKPDHETTGCVDDAHLAPVRAAFAKATWKTTKSATALCNEAIGPASWIDYSGPNAAWKEERCTLEVLDTDSAKAIALLRKLQATVAKVPVPGHAK